MVISILGECDKRPVLYTLMKICQTLGDVLVISNNSYLNRLSDTREPGGHYQNTMIVVTQEGIDDFMEGFAYGYSDFDYVLMDNVTAAEADLVIYVEGMVRTEEEEDMLEYIDDYETIKLYEGKLTFANTLWMCEEFEAYRTMCPINQPIAHEVAAIMSKATGKSLENIEEIAMQPTSTHKPKSSIKLPNIGKKGGKR